MAALNPFFNTYRSAPEQDVLDRLTNEYVSVYGVAMYYVPRDVNNRDALYVADDQSSYTRAFLVPVLVESVDGFMGDGNFMAKFGLEIRDQITLALTRRAFSEEVGSVTGQTRPNEGDVIYYPLNDKCFQVKFTEKLEVHYPLGALYSWRLTCELFEYSDEVFATGVPEIDRVQSVMTTNILDYALLDEFGNQLVDDAGDYLTLPTYNLGDIVGAGANEVIKAESDAFIEFNDADPFAEGMKR